MLLSSFINDVFLDNEYKIRNENEFSTLGKFGTVTKDSFCTFLSNIKYIQNIPDNAVMVFTTKELAASVADRGLCIVDEPRAMFSMVHNYLHNNSEYRREKFKTIIGSNCEIGSLSSIAKENVIIGDNVIVENFATIKENTVIGDNCVINSGVVVGNEGFEGVLFKGIMTAVRHLGGVILRNNVELQANTCVDKALFPYDDTVIGENVKIDNLVHVGHAAKIERNVEIAASAIIGGNTKIGENSWIGIGAVISNALIIGKNTRANLGAVVTKNIPDGESVSGNFAIRHERFIDFIKTIR